MALQYSIATLLSVWLILLYLGTGAAFYRILRVPGSPSYFDLLVKVGIGFGFTGNAVMVLNFIQRASAHVIIAWLILQTLIMIPFIISEIVSIPGYWKRVTDTIRGTHILLTLPLIIVFSLFIVRSMLPPTGFDALMYHLSTIDLYLKHGGFYDIFFNPQSDFPMLTEMNFMIGLALGNDIVCRQIAFLTFLIACGGVYYVSRFSGLNKNYSILAILLFATATSTIAEVPECNVDFALASWILFGLLLAYRSTDLNSGRLILLASFFAGMSIQTKIFGCFVIPLMLFAVYYKKKKPVIKSLIVPAIVIACMATPWYIKSYLYNGSILPVSTSTLEGQGLGNPMNFAISSPLVYHLVNIPLRIIAAPWTFSLMPSQHQGDTFGPFLIAVLPFLLLFRQSRNSKFLLLLLMGYLLQVLMMEMVFIKGGSSIRYSIFIQIVGIPIALVVLQNIKAVFPKTGLLLRSLLFVQIVLGSFLLVKRYHKDWKAIVFSTSRTEYLRSVLPEYPIIEYINTHCTDGVVMTAYNFSNYYLQCRYISQYKKCKTEPEFVNELKRHGVRYLFANNTLDASSNSVAFSILKNKSVIKSENGFYLYRVQF